METSGTYNSLLTKSIRRLSKSFVLMVLCGGIVTPNNRATALVASRYQQADLNAALLKAIKTQSEAKIKVLLEQGADVNAKDKEGATTLLYALLYKPHNISILKMLLDKGGDLNVRWKGTQPKNDMSLPGGMTPLILAAWTGNLGATQLLLENGAQINATDENGWSALMRCVAMGLPSDARIVRALIAKGADLSIKDKEGTTALLLTALPLHSEVAAVLLESGADVNNANTKGETVLMLAVERAGNPGRVTRQTLTFIKLFLDRGANKNAQDQSHSTALERAEIMNQPEITYLLRTGNLPPLRVRILPRPTHDLLRQAKSILKLDSPLISYWWRSSTQVMLTKYVPKKNEFEPTWFRYDLKTGQQVKETSLKASVGEVRLSPDGRRLLSYQNESSRLTWAIADLPRGIFHQYPVSSALQKRLATGMMYAQTWGWMQDSRHWVLLFSTLAEEQLHALVFDQNTRGLVRDVKVSFPKEKNFLFSEILPGILLGFSPKGYAVTTTGVAANKPVEKVDIFEFRLDKAATSARKFSVRLPTKALASVVLSPTGRQLAWLLRVEGATQDTVELWISQSDGSGMRGIGYLQITDLAGSLPSSLQWKPEGKNLSFICNNTLYSVSTE